jgi:hypothetical protein
VRGWGDAAVLQVRIAALMKGLTGSSRHPARMAESASSVQRDGSRVCCGRAVRGDCVASGVV